MCDNSKETANTLQPPKKYTKNSVIYTFNRVLRIEILTYTCTFCTSRNVCLLALSSDWSGQPTPVAQCQLSQVNVGFYKIHLLFLYFTESVTGWQFPYPTNISRNIREKKNIFSKMLISSVCPIFLLVSAIFLHFRILKAKDFYFKRVRYKFPPCRKNRGYK
jgi:hypothetical protein